MRGRLAGVFCCNLLLFGAERRASEPADAAGESRVKLDAPTGHAPRTLHRLLSRELGVGRGPRTNTAHCLPPFSTKISASEALLPCLTHQCTTTTHQGNDDDTWALFGKRQQRPKPKSSGGESGYRWASLCTSLLQLSSHVALFTAATMHSSAHPADCRYVTLSRGHPGRCSAVSTLKANLVFSTLSWLKLGPNIF